MASFSSNSFSTSAFSTNSFSLDGTTDDPIAWAAVNSPITNSNATADAGNRNNVCMRTGFRVKPHTLVEDAYGSLVRFESYDRRHPQELIRPLAEELTGPKRPETEDVFISTSVSPEDL